MISVSDQVVSYYSRKDSKEKHFTLTHKKQNHRSTKREKIKIKRKRKFVMPKFQIKREKNIYIITKNKDRGKYNN